jgi:hypothetical protein
LPPSSPPPPPGPELPPPPEPEWPDPEPPLPELESPPPDPELLPKPDPPSESEPLPPEPEPPDPEWPSPSLANAGVPCPNPGTWARSSAIGAAATSAPSEATVRSFPARARARHLISALQHIPGMAARLMCARPRHGGTAAGLLCRRATLAMQRRAKGPIGGQTKVRGRFAPQRPARRRGLRLALISFGREANQ